MKASSIISLEPFLENFKGITKPSQKVLAMLDRPTQRRIIARIRELSLAPFDPRISSWVMLGHGERKSRVGNWRIFYEVDKGTGLIIILAVRPRARAYRKF